jgi:diguanylate cyclase (GGDEF)-like protein/putative nucleotidyltransferase with HDIG domain
VSSASVVLQVDSIIHSAREAERLGQRELARDRYEEALHAIGRQRSSDPAADASLASSILRWIGRTYQIDAEYDAALDCIDAALAVAESITDAGATGHAINLRAIVRWQQGDLDAAERDYRSARLSAICAGDAQLAAMTAQNLGVIASIRGDFAEALHNYETSLSEYRRLGLAHDVCVALNNLGKVFTETARWAEARRSYGEALQISAALGDIPSQILLHVNLAELAVAQGLNDDARTACDRATELMQRTNDMSSLGEIQRLYGVIARDCGRVVDAEQHLAEADRIAAERKELLLQAQTAREMAVLYRGIGRNRDALQYLNRSHRLFSQMRAQHDLAEVMRRMTSLEGEFLEIVKRWGESIESKDRYTQGHCERVADLACALAARTGMDAQSLFWFRIGALLHDVGKIVIPEEVLNKPGRLDPEEWVLVKQHPSAGVEILSTIEFPWDIRPIVESHHECWDGSGYPHGLSGEAIPLTARILGVADVYDALTSERSYKKAMSHEQAMGIMRREVGRQFDPELFATFEALFESAPAWRASSPATSDATPATSQSDQSRPVAIDDVTGLPLRRAFLEHANAVIASGAGASLMVIDVDGFKRVNDSFGHLQGDAVLRGVATALREGVRSSDFVARFGGDEFVILLCGAPLHVATETAERLRVAIAGLAHPIREAPGQSMRVTISVGIAHAPDQGSTTDELFAAADRALYSAKRRGRNVVLSAAEASSAAETRQLELLGFAGRARELTELRRHLQSAVAGRPRVVGIVGEAGAGKSRLVKELAPEVRLLGGSLVSGSASEADVRPPYGVWIEILRALSKEIALPLTRWREVSRLLPSERTADVIDASVASKYVMLEELAEAVRFAAAECPLVLVLEDMQWGDAASWDALEYVLRGIDTSRLLICVTIRSEDLTSIGDRRRRLLLDERFSELWVPRLSIDDLRDWMQVAVGRRDVSDDLLAFVHRHTEGNPLLVVHTLRSLTEDGALAYRDASWHWRPVTDLRLPSAVQGMIQGRLERLGAETRGILAVAAVVGRTFDVDMVLEAGSATEDEVLAALDHGVGAHVIAPIEDASGDRYTFTHAVLADAFLRGLNPRRFRRLHARVADVLVRRSPHDVVRIASHFAAAESREEACHYALLGARRAIGLGAPAEAMRCLEVAQRYATTSETQLGVRIAMAEASEAAGEYAAAERQCDLALEETSVLGPRERLSVERIRERLRALQGCAPGRTLAACRALLARAVELDLTHERAQLLNMVAVAHHRLGEWKASESAARESLDVARADGDLRLHADAYSRLGTALLETDAVQARVQYDAALQLYRALGERYGEIRCHINLGIALWRAGEIHSAERSYQMARDLAASSHAPDLIGLASLNLGVLRMESGDLDTAATLFREALSRFDAVRSESHRAAALFNLANTMRERAQTADALATYETAVELAATTGQLDLELGARAGAGLCLLSEGRIDDAAGASVRVSERLAGREDQWFQGRELVEALAIRVAASAGDVSMACRMLQDVVERAMARDPRTARRLVAECSGPLCGTEPGRTAVQAILERLDGVPSAAA